jgi:hypothetical protein
MLHPDRPWGKVTNLAREYGISRETVYNIAAKGEQALLAGLEPGGYGPQPPKTRVTVTRNRLVRGTVVLAGEGVSQRGITRCLAELVDTERSLGWVNGELAKAEQAAAQVNADWQPSVGETLSGDEIYSHGAPNLIVVGNDSLYIYALTRQERCDGGTWQSVLLDCPETPQFASDAGTGLAAGVKAAGIAPHQLDWDHLLRPLWNQATRLEKQAYAALQDVEERADKFDQAHTPKRLANHLAVWERLSAKAAAKLARYDDFVTLAEQIDAQFGLIDITSGEVRDPVAGADVLRQVGRQLQGWEGRIYQKLSRNLINWADAMFCYHPVLQDAFAPVVARWGQEAVQALSRIWQIEADEKRHPQSVAGRQVRQDVWEQSLDTAYALLGSQELWSAWADVNQVLDRSWRGSMLAECVNGLARPLLRNRQHTDQGCLELFRFLHNVHIFERGKRANWSPAQLVGIDVPADVLTLLGLDPKAEPESADKQADRIPDAPPVSAFAEFFAAPVQERQKVSI